jgi:Ala-tRNA(Pro) deacylase
MPLAERLRSFLDSQRTEYSVTVHPQAYTARELAAVEHLPAQEVAKTVVVFGDGEYRMIVVPANKLVDFQEVRVALGLNHLRLATEEELAKLFPDCEVGAMPPFGELYGIEVYLDPSIAGEETIAFNAGTHRDVVHMRVAEFRRLARPAVLPCVR